MAAKKLSPEVMRDLEEWLKMLPETLERSVDQ